MGNFDFDVAADVFYGELFRLFPAIEALFSSVHAQRSMFVTALRTIYYSKPDDPDLRTYLELLGTKHKTFGINRMHMEAALRAFGAAIDAADPDIADETRDRLIGAFLRLQRTMGI